jgi:Thrombospondin type 3 repeat
MMRYLGRIGLVALPVIAMGITVFALATHPTSVAGDETGTPTPTPTATPLCTDCPSMELDADPSTDGIQTTNNLQMMEMGCVDPEEGLGCLVVDRWILNAYDADSPRDPDEDPEGVGAWEARTQYDHLTVVVTPVAENVWIESGGRIASCLAVVINEDTVMGGCVTRDGPSPGMQLGPNGSGRVERLIIVPQTDLFGQPGDPDNVAVEIGSSDCELTDVYAEHVPGTLPGELTATCSGVTITIHRPCPGDAECDGVLDTADNCPLAPNADQLNGDGGRRPNGSQVDGEWASNPAADGLGDACDPDTDNDGLPDSSENDASCPYRLVGDSDGDGALDGYETAQGKDPCNAADKPVCSGSLDSDGDGIFDCVEHLGYNTCASADDDAPGWTACADPADSDGDACADWIEIVDVNGNGQADILDALFVAKRAFNLIPASDSDPVLDMDKNDSVNLIDALLAAKNSNLVRSHSPCSPEG